MAEGKKKFSELDQGTVPFEGTETIAAVQGGITKRGTISGIHGAGWWDKLKAGFVDFVAPEALHANDADTATLAATAHTPATATNNTQIATTAFVKAQLLAVIYPIGCYYTQYPNASSNVDATEFPVAQRPATLFGGIWDEQWANESVFFRTRGTLSDTGRTSGKQEDQMQQITGSFSGLDGASITHVRVGAFSAIGTGKPDTTSNKMNSGAGGVSFDSANSPGARTGTETRPVNRRIKVWKRTA